MVIRAEIKPDISRICTQLMYEGKFCLEVFVPQKLFKTISFYNKANQS